MKIFFSDRLILKTIVGDALLVVTLYNDTTDTAAGGYPDVMVLVLCNTADIVVAQTLFLRQIVQRVVLEVQDIQSLARSNPNQSARVLHHLCDIVVGERLDIGFVTCEYSFLCG